MKLVEKYDGDGLSKEKENQKIFFGIIIILDGFFYIKNKNKAGKKKRNA